jgi:hypothetical protein
MAGFTAGFGQRGSMDRAK